MANEDGLDHVTKLAHELFEDPTTRPMIEHAIATKYPERAAVAVPGYVMRQEFEKERAEFRKERDQEKAERATAAAQAQADKDRASWARSLHQHGARPEEIKDMTDFAIKRNNADPEAVVDTYRKHQELAAPTSSRWSVQIPGVKAGEFFKGLDEGGGDRWARERAAADIQIIKTHGVDALERMAPSPLR